MDATSRNAIRKRKAQTRSTAALSHATNLDVEGIREATRHKFTELLSGEDDDPARKAKAQSIAASIEKAMDARYKAHAPAYRGCFRRLYVSLKSKQLNLSTRLLNGELEPEDFALKSAEELKSDEQRSSDKDLREKGLQQSVTNQFLPENVNQVKDGRDREKWGVSRSAAAIDD